MDRRTFHKLFGMGIIGSAGVLDSISGPQALGQVMESQGRSRQDSSKQDRLGWFREAKFGMMIHWGLYSVLGGEWHGKQLPVPGGNEGQFHMETNVEMIMEPFRIPLAEYREIGKRFDPVNFDAQRWVGLAKTAGMKYLVVTAKHQDGFAMFHSRVSKYNIVDATPFKRDPLKELSEACQQQGVRFCVYYSHRDDWEDPNSYGNYWDFHERKRNFEKYYEEKAMPQVRELLTGYGPVGLVWYDHGIYTVRQAEQMVDLVRSLQPDCLVNSRVLVDSRAGSSWPENVGDYDSTGDHGLPASGMQNYFEVPQTMNRCWGYSKFDHNWKSPQEVIHQLVGVVSKGGNYLLDVGPTGAGIIPQPAVDTLEKVGPWMERNSESVYGTTESLFGELPWGLSTTKGEKIYLHIFEWPKDGKLLFAGLKNEVKKAYPLTDNTRSLEVTRNENRFSIQLPGTPVDEYDTVVVLDIVGKPEIETPVVAQKDDSFLMLTALTAVTTAKAIKYFDRNGGYHISKWNDPRDTVTWEIEIDRPQRYQVWITYAAQRSGMPGKKYRVSVGSATLDATVFDSGAYCFDTGLPCDTGYQYRTYNIGIVDLPEAGPYKLEIRPAGTSDIDLMYLKSIQLTPLAEQS